MSNVYQTTPIVVSSGNALTMTAGEDLFVDTSLVTTDSGGDGVFCSSNATIVDNGFIEGGNGIVVGTSGPALSNIQIATTGEVAAWNDGGQAIEVSGAFDVVNNGQIYVPGFAVGVVNFGAGTWTNYGVIDCTELSAIVDDDSTATDVVTTYNYGTITGGDSYDDGFSSGGEQTLVNHGTMNGAIYIGNSSDNTIENFGTIEGAITLDGNTSLAYGADDSVTNEGLIDGGVSLGNGADQVFNSTLGSVNGAVACGSGGDVAIAGQTGGTVTGGSGADALYANPTSTAADNVAKTTLDGRTGDNWLYGDGAYTTFMSGDNAAGTYNQIFGGASQMEGVSGYTNNTVDYAGMSSAYKSAYIDLLHGDTYMCTIADANGAPSSDLVFEDYLQNVPNVIGTSGSDVIICDNGVDRITHGSGAGDVLYAGTGAASQDTFAYTNLDESPLSDHDIIEGFKVGIDKIDLTALDLPIADVFLSYGGDGSNTIYVEKDPAIGFNSATDMIISVQASTSTAMTYKDIIG
jgi:Peptidase M10 serralysin C terminal